LGETKVVLSYIKKRSRGFPSSESRKVALENAVINCTSRVDACMLKFLKYGAQFDSAITKAGYRELRVPDVVATIEYTDWRK